MTIQEHKHIVVCLGPAGSGKTSYLRLRMQEEPINRVCYRKWWQGIDFADFAGMRLVVIEDISSADGLDQLVADIHQHGDPTTTFILSTQVAGAFDVRRNLFFLNF